jgi:glycosyltransferase involved in cell wall biosynthesis
MHLKQQPHTTAPAQQPPFITTHPTPSGYRILMIAPTSFFADYGCHVRILEEARVLHKLGHQVTVVTYRNGKDMPGLDIERTSPIPWRRHYEVGSSRHKIAFDGLLGVKTLALLASRRYDIIHAHLHEGALIGLVLGWLFRIPVVFDFQGSLTEEMIDHHFLSREGAFYKPLRRLECWIDRKPPVVFTNSAHAKRILTEQFGCPPAHIRILPDCVNCEVFRPATELDGAEQLALRRSLGVPDGHKVIVYLGLLAEYQGTGLLLEAMQRILQQHPDVFLLLMGFPGVQSYRRKAEALGIGHAVTLTGRVAYMDAPRYVALGDVAVAPKLSQTEGAGKLLNYMAAGLPTVAFDTPVAREYLGRDGQLALRGDVDSLAQVLADCLFPPASAPHVMSELGLRLRQRAIQQFDWQQAGALIVETYKDLLDRQAGRAVSESMPAAR